MIFFYNGFKLNLLNKKWTPSKNIKLTNQKEENVFITYNFQKKYLDIDPTNIFQFPLDFIHPKIYNEYLYMIKSKNYNL
jgi:hypothetical protein